MEANVQDALKMGKLHLQTTVTLATLCGMSLFATLVAQDGFQRYLAIFVACASFCVSLIGFFETWRIHVYLKRERSGYGLLATAQERGAHVNPGGRG